MNTKYIFECGNVRINVYAALSEESAKKILKEQIFRAKEDLDIFLPNSDDFVLVAITD
jgi:hypothetical protein